MHTQVDRAHTSLVAHGAGPAARKVSHDLWLLATFVRLYCDGLHGQRSRAPVRLRHVDVAAVCGAPVLVCATCRKLLQHAFVKRISCPLEPKPACKHCPAHCYAPSYREQMRAVMRYSGRRLVLSGRLDYLWHLLF